MVLVLVLHKDDNQMMLMIRPELVTFDGEEQKILISSKHGVGLLLTDHTS